MGKLKFSIGDEVINTRTDEKGGVVIEYHRETREYGIRLSNEETHYEPPRYLEKATNHTSVY